MKHNGFGIIEILIVIAIIGIAFFGISRVVQLCQRITIEAKLKEQALNLTKEALEAVRGIRDESWDNISGLIMEAEYHPAISGTPTSWQLASESEIINNFFTRKIVFASVSRDADDDIEEVYNPNNDDSNTKKVTATVLFKDEKVEIVTYITNWKQ